MHIYQIKKAKNDWIKLDDIDSIIYNVVNILFKIIEQIESNAVQTFENIKIFISCILTAADNLADKRNIETKELFPKIDDYRQTFKLLN